MKYCVYISKNSFDTEITKIKKMIESKKDDSVFEINYKLSQSNSLCYAFIKEKNQIAKEYILKAMLYV